MIEIRVVGTPAPQGSHKAFVVNGRASIVDDSKKTRPWRQDVREAALQDLEPTVEKVIAAREALEGDPEDPAA